MKSGVSGLTEQKIEAIVGCQVQKNDGKGLALEKEKKKKKKKKKKKEDINHY